MRAASRVIYPALRAPLPVYRLDASKRSNARTLSVARSSAPRRSLGACPEHRRLNAWNPARVLLARAFWPTCRHGRSSDDPCPRGGRQERPERPGTGGRRRRHSGAPQAQHKGLPAATDLTGRVAHTCRRRERHNNVPRQRRPRRSRARRRSPRARSREAQNDAGFTTRATTISGAADPDRLIHSGWFAGWPWCHGAPRPWGKKRGGQDGRLQGQPDRRGARI